jgi:hypothetical protein
MKGKRRWVGRRVWVLDRDGKRRGGIVWFENESDVLIRADGVVGLRTLPMQAQGIRWGFADNSDPTSTDSNPHDGS